MFERESVVPLKIKETLETITGESLDLCFSSRDLRRAATQGPAAGKSVSPPPTVSELCTLLVFLLDVIPLVSPSAGEGGSRAR